MWEPINYVTLQILIMRKNFGKHLVIICVYLWFQAVPYNCTNITSIWLHCNDLIYSVHKEITLLKLFIC